MLSKDEIIKLIQKTMAGSPFNNFGLLGKPDEPMWGAPIVGFARGDDPYFAYYKDAIGEFYWLPSEVFQIGKGEAVQDEKLTVISIGFPKTQATKADQNKAVDLPCDRWLSSRAEWDGMIRIITSEIVALLNENGIEAISLEAINALSRQRSKNFGIASNWSHRHTAFIAGLGTFGLSDGLITEKGKAIRFTTIVIKAKIEATARPYEDYHAYCKFYSENKCGACISRCPVNAITREGHNKELCDAYLQKIKKETGPDYIRNSNYFASCGLCQSKVPCQDKIPR